MPKQNKTREEALRSLSMRAKALEVKTVVTPSDYGVKAAGYGYRVLGVLIGGVFVGLGLGAVVDATAKTGPFGMIVGVLAGFGVSIWFAVRSARKASAEMSAVWGPARDLPDDEGDDD